LPQSHFRRAVDIDERLCEREVRYMVFRLIDARFLTALAVSGFMIAVAGCQSGDSAAVLGSADAPPPPEKIAASELRAYCPKVSLREGTAFFNTYAKGGQDDPAKIIYQASITDVTRSCARADGMMTMNVAVAGKVVPGPVGSPGTVTMPIRIAVMRGDEVLYSQLHKYPVTVGDVASQFVFSDPNVTFPIPAEPNVQVFAGYDEGPAAKVK
jgi:hypothetical protein